MRNVAASLDERNLSCFFFSRFPWEWLHQLTFNFANLTLIIFIWKTFQDKQFFAGKTLRKPSLNIHLKKHYQGNVQKVKCTTKSLFLIHRRLQHDHWPGAIIVQDRIIFQVSQLFLVMKTIYLSNFGETLFSWSK